MKAQHLFAMTAVLSFPAAALAAENGEALFNKHSCNVCHNVDKKGVGPALTAVAGKYRGDSGAQARLEKKMRSGGSGAWGSMPMPPVAKSVSDEDIKTIIQWTLSLK